MEIIIYSPLGKPAGRIEGTTFYTLRQPNHFMRQYQGFGISESVLNQLKERGVKTIAIKYIGKTTIFYSCPLEKFLNSNKTYTYSNFDRTGGVEDKQYFVSTRDMVQ